MAQEPANTTSTEEKTSSSSTATAPVVRDLDLVIYGATGFTGQYLCKYLASRCARDTESSSSLTWGIAGRNQRKLETLRNVLKDTYTQTLASINANNNASNGTTSTPLDGLPLLTADVTDLASLKLVVSRAKLIISCVGPFRMFGENVIRCCAELGTHYVDICGEPEFIERCAFKYFSQANKNGAIIVSACGFDSIPSDMGQTYLDLLFKKEFQGICNNIEVYMTFSAPKGYPGHVTTFEAAVHGFGGADELRQLRKEMNESKDGKWRHGRKEVNRMGPKLKLRKETYFWSDKVKRYSMVFPFADSAVVSNSQGTLSKMCLELNGVKRIFPQFAAYLCFNSRMAAYQAVAVGGFGMMMTKFGWGKSLLLNYPETVTLGAFTHAGPTEEQMDATTFTARFFGEGYSKETVARVKKELSENESKSDEKAQSDVNKNEMSEVDRLENALKNVKPDLKIETSVSGGDPGYKATAMMCVETGLCLIQDLELIQKGNEELGIPAIKGGVFTPGAVFAASNLVQRLTKAGIEFKLVSPAPASSAAASVAPAVAPSAAAAAVETKVSN